MEILGFEVYHEYIIEYVEAVEHNSWTFEVHFDTFSVFQTVWGILYLFAGSRRIVENPSKISEILLCNLKKGLKGQNSGQIPSSKEKTLTKERGLN